MGKVIRKIGHGVDYKVRTRDDLLPTFELRVAGRHGNLDWLAIDLASEIGRRLDKAVTINFWLLPDTAAFHGDIVHEGVTIGNIKVEKSN